jgi:broad specificity phosphatase PhoE
VPDHLIVIRSGATDYDLQERIRGTLDMPLSAEGIAAATRTAQQLAANPPSTLYTSAAACAIETSRIIGLACGLKPRPAANLGNLDLGLWQGRLVEEIRDTQPRLHRQWQDNPWSVAPPDGELLEEACERVEDALEKIFRRHSGGRIALVVPQPLDAIVRWLVSGRSMGDLWLYDPQAELADEIPIAAQWSSSRSRSGSAGPSAAVPGRPFVSR